MQIILNGIKYTKDKKTGYYLGSKNHPLTGKRERLHTAVWMKHNGLIPEGFHIHHIDEDKENNDISNLVLLDQSEHARLHGKDEGKKEWFKKDIQPMGVEEAKKWHASEEGRKWHSENGKKAWENKKVYSKNCQVCGEEYETYFPSRSKFCGENCKMKNLRKRYKEQGKDYSYGQHKKKPKVKKECVVCETKFETPIKTKRTCSEECSKEDKRINERERQRRIRRKNRLDS